MITEARILLPVMDNKGESLWFIHSNLRAELLETFGGFSESSVAGTWKDMETGKIYRDESTAYDIAAEWNAANCEKLNTLAARFCGLTEQVCLYVRHGNGAVSYVCPAPAQAQTAQQSNAA